MKSHHRVLLGTVTILALASACTSSSNDASDTTVAESTAPVSEDLPPLPTAFTPVIGNTVSPEMATVYAADGRWHLVYELLLTNAKQVPATIESIEVLDAFDTGRVLKLITADDIVAETFQLSGRPRLEPDSTTLLGDDGVLVPNESTVLFIEISFNERADVPDAIVHRFRGQAANNPGSTEPDAIEYLFVSKAITERTAASIGAPLSGDGWTVINGCCLANGAHRGSIQTVNGKLWNAQRFAIDWMKIGENGRFFDGNHVILDLGRGVYAFYAHLKLGSVSVELGDKVEAGQQIGELGNSGNTSGPHLHLHLMSEPSALAADSIPYGYNEIEFVGNVSEAQWDNTTDELADVWDVTPDARDGLDRPVLPMNLNVVNFP